MLKKLTICQRLSTNNKMSKTAALLTWAFIFLLTLFSLWGVCPTIANSIFFKIDIATAIGLIIMAILLRKELKEDQTNEKRPL
jgi:hypothetical protein